MWWKIAASLWRAENSVLGYQVCYTHYLYTFYNVKYEVCFFFDFLKNSTQMTWADSGWAEHVKWIVCSFLFFGSSGSVCRLLMICGERVVTKFDQRQVYAHQQWNFVWICNGPQKVADFWIVSKGIIIVQSSLYPTNLQIQNCHSKSGKDGDNTGLVHVPIPYNISSVISVHSYNIL